MTKIMRLIPGLLIVVFILCMSIFSIGETTEFVLFIVIFIITYLILFRLYSLKQLSAQRIYIYALFIAIAFAVHMYHSHFIQQ